MSKSFAFLIVALMICPRLCADVTTKHGKLTLIHARATTVPAKVRLKILEPTEGQVVSGHDVSVRFTVENWNPEKNGKHLHFILDDEPFQSHFSRDPFVFKNVKPGAHIIRAFPVQAWHESVKQQNAIAIVRFYVKEKSAAPTDTSGPMLIYSTPVGTHESMERLPGQPHPGVLIDWFLHNISMGSKAGYFVRISVDGEVLMSMKEWRPHYLQGLSPGNHKIKLELLKNGKPLTENGNTTERKITIK